MPGCGCEEQKCEFMAMELKKRLKKRGDTAQVQLAEAALKKASDIHRKMDLIASRILLTQQQQQQQHHHHQQQQQIEQLDQQHMIMDVPINDTMDDR